MRFSEARDFLNTQALNLSKLINSETIARLAYLPIPYEPGIEHASSSSIGGIFIGNSYKYNMPVFLDPETLLNPHILICGMTGGGKTYLGKSLLVRMHLFCNANIIIIDFTGEYYDVVHNLATAPSDSARAAFTDSEAIAYIDLHCLNESEKISAASETLDIVAQSMRKRPKGYKRRIFLLLDEAWKLVEESRGLEVIIREGRKYGVGMVTSSQLLHDTSSTILSNVAAVFIFRTTNKRSLELISKNYNLSEREVLLIQNLELGGCFIIQLYKSGSRSAFGIRKVIGVRNTGILKIVKSGNMETLMNMTDFEHMVNSLCGPGKAGAIIEKANENSITLPELIAALIRHNADRRSILAELSRIGFTYSEIADAFSIALSKIGCENED